MCAGKKRDDLGIKSLAHVNEAMVLIQLWTVVP